MTIDARILIAANTREQGDLIAKMTGEYFADVLVAADSAEVAADFEPGLQSCAGRRY